MLTIILLIVIIAFLIFITIKQSKIMATQEEAAIEVAKVAFYKGFEKCEKDDANCFTAWREEAANILSLISELK